MAIPHFIRSLLRDSRWEVTCHERIKSRQATFASFQDSLSREFIDFLKARSGNPNLFINKMEGLYLHQVRALRALRENLSVVIATPVASGKSLVYYLAFAEELVKNPQARALFVFPIKALSRDQMENARRFFEPLFPGINTAVYDGDTSERERIAVRNHIPQILITNPDMLHYSMLPYHAKWQRFWENLRYVVFDEIHTYRGVFGSHVAQILRRLKRIHAYYTGDKGPLLTFVFLSATIGNPKELAVQLSGLPEDDIAVVNDSSAPEGERNFVFLKSDYPLSTTTYWILKKALEEGLKTIAFTRSRRLTELIYLTLRQRAPTLARYVSSYRAGLLPSDRRTIEKRLSQGGDLRGIIATSAMELGIDIGDLDVCLLVGYPGTIMNTLQRAGRVGRGGQESAVVLIPQQDALDQYIVSNPHHVLSGNVEIAVVDPKNRDIAKSHLVCAAAEIPIKPDEITSNPFHLSLLRELKAYKILHEDLEGRWFCGSTYPHRHMDLRQAGKSFSIFLKEGSKSSLGSVDGVRAFRECHPGAIYLHLGETFIVTSLDMEHRNIFIKPFDGRYFTIPKIEKETEILEIIRSKPVRNFVLKLGRLKITEQVVGYEKKSTKTLETLGSEGLKLPPQSYETVGIWIEVDPWINKWIKDKGFHFMGALHALEHALISMFPLFILCDRGDIGGIATPLHPQVKKSAIFIYDGYEGGIGISEKSFEFLEMILDKVQDLLEKCSCEDGCPACIHSPRCGSGNKPLDKKGARNLVAALSDGNILKTFSSSFVSTIDSSFETTKPQKIEEVFSEKIAFFDLETQFLASEVGGWQNKHLMRVSVAVLYDELLARYFIYRENEVENLIERLKNYDLIVGFNILNFDYGVLEPYTPVNLYDLPTFDILREFKEIAGFRLSLDHLAMANLNETKGADGIKAVAWFREGNWKDLVEYCKKDVMITKRLFYKAIERGSLMYRDKQGCLLKVDVPWTKASILKEYAKHEQSQRNERSENPLRQNGSWGMFHHYENTG